MNLPIFCGRCGAPVPEVTIDDDSFLLKYDPYKQPLGGIPGAGAPCPNCGATNGPEVVRESLSVIWTATSALRKRAERERLRTTIEELRETQARLAEVESRLESDHPQINGLRRLLPRSQEGVVAYLSFLVALVTLVENTIADHADLREAFTSPRPSPSTSMPSPASVEWSRYPMSSVAPGRVVTFSGTASFPDGHGLYSYFFFAPRSRAIPESPPRMFWAPVPVHMGQWAYQWPDDPEWWGPNAELWGIVFLVAAHDVVKFSYPVPVPGVVWTQYRVRGTTPNGRVKVEHLRPPRQATLSPEQRSLTVRSLLEDLPIRTHPVGLESS
ncbi:hypothetical protein GCM10009555_098670 [Acrocarpospora macrocephala]|uniref:Uncharacterized protein n=1 Tax=Acrocarpospora macrocephala TaxID=150177 RepID=A0A5M3XB06_9ACTN|nr:hypothetical protein Amac_102790 [Acrocarpospora macrocephala]